MIDIQLTDLQSSEILQVPEAPFTQTIVEGAVDVQKLNRNLSTYFTYNKRQWSHTWAYMSKADYDIMIGFYERMWTNRKYPLLTISALGINDVPVRMYTEPKNIIDNCETVQNVTVSWRETGQM